jgi:hypothetical protein
MVSTAGSKCTPDAAVLHTALPHAAERHLRAARGATFIGTPHSPSRPAPQGSQTSTPTTHHTAQRPLCRLLDPPQCWLRTQGAHSPNDLPPPSHEPNRALRLRRSATVHDHSRRNDLHTCIKTQAIYLMSISSLTCDN